MIGPQTRIQGMYVHHKKVGLIFPEGCSVFVYTHIGGNGSKCIQVIKMAIFE